MKAAKQYKYMTRYLMVLKLGFSLSLFFVNASAQALTWQEAKNEMKRENFKIKSSVRAISLSENELKQAKSGHYPTIELRAATERFLQEDASLGFRTYIGPRLLWNLYQGGKVKHTKALAQVSLLKSEQNKSQHNIQQENQLRRAFSQGIHARKNLKLALLALSRAQNNARYVKLRYKSGQEYAWVFDTAKKNILQSEVDVLQAQTAAKKSLDYLNQVMGKNSVESLDILDEKSFEKVPFMENLDLETYMQQHPKIKMAQNAIESSRLNYKISKSAKKPSLLLRTDLVLIDTDDKPIIPFLYSGLSFSMPLLDAGLNKSKIRSAKIQQRSAQDKHSELKKNQKIRIDQQYTAYKIAFKNIDLAALNHRAVKGKYKLYKNQYREGLIEFRFWDQAQQELRQAEMFLINSARDIHLEYGKLLLELGITEDKL